MFDVIIPVYNNLDITKRCVDSVRKHTESGLYRIFIINDGSTDGTDDWCRYDNQEIENFFFHTKKKNEGYVKATIKGVELACGCSNFPYIFILNNDVTLLSWWARDAMKMLKNRKVGIIGAYGIKDIAGQKIHFISGSRLIVKKSVIEKVGFYDPSF